MSPRSQAHSGRPPESRDHRLKRKMRLRAFMVVALSLFLGILAALFMQRCDPS